MDDLGEMIAEYETQAMKEDPHFHINRDYLNHKPFLEHFKNKEEWKPYFQEGEQGTMARLLSLDDVFFEQRVIKCVQNDLSDSVD